MDIGKYAESEFVTVQLVKESNTKKLVILDQGSEQAFENKVGLVFLVNIDGKTKKWKPNKLTLSNLIKSLTTNSDAWVGKTVDLRIEFVKGKDSVVGVVSQ